MADEFYVGVGCVEAQLLPFAVLRHSILKYADRPITVEPLYRAGIEVPVPREERNRQKTPFSFQRFIIPAVRNYKGRAVYLDSDMLVVQDIGALFDLDFGDADVLAVPRETSVLVLDCEKLSWNIRDLVGRLDSGTLSYDGLMMCRSIAGVRYSISSDWNWLDNSPHPKPDSLALLHYTVTTSQPWVSSGHRYGALWLQELFDALDDGSLHRDDVGEAVRRGFVRPSLLFQVDHRVLTKAEIPSDVLRADGSFSEYCRSVNYMIVDGQHAKR